MGRVAVDFGVGEGAKRSADIPSDLGPASNAGQRQNQRNRWQREAEGQLAASLGRCSRSGDAPPSLLAIRPSASTRDPLQYFNSLLGDQSNMVRLSGSTARSLDKEFAAPVGWVGIENRLRERPWMSPWVEERALAFAIHVIRGFSEYTSTGCLGA